VQQARVAENLLADTAQRDDPDRRAAIDAQVERAADALGRLADSAHDDAARLPCSSAAESLRGLMFALEADRLLRAGQRPPTAEQLSQADGAVRTTAAQLNASLAELDAQLAPERAS
jgi:uncharacterized phage protein gp47/JayE